MKSLNTDQISIIEEILLETYNLKYDHLRIEILDHIASETEALINKEALPFDLALKTVFKLWHKELQTKKMGTYKDSPRMVVTLWRRLDLQYLLILMAISTLVFAVMYGFEVEESKVEGGVFCLLVLNVLVSVKTISVVFDSSQKTVINEYVKKGILGLLTFNIYLLIMVFVSNRPEPKTEGIDWGVYVPIFLGLAIFVRLLLGYRLMKKSLIIEENTLKIQ